jgi:hypothetical protein
MVLGAVVMMGLPYVGLSGREKDIKDRFSAQVLTRGAGLIRVSVELRDYTSQHEFGELAELFKKGGRSALHKRLRKAKKGYLLFEYGPRTDVRIADIRTTEKGRRILVLAERAADIDEFQRADILRDYPYVCVDVEFDSTGRGRGIIMYYAKIYFTPDLNFAVENWSVKNMELTNVQLD